MPDQVLIYSRFPKAMMVRIGQRFELMDAAGKPPGEVFTAEQLSGIRAMITAGGTPLGAAMMDTMPKTPTRRPGLPGCGLISGEGFAADQFPLRTYPSAGSKRRVTASISVTARSATADAFAAGLCATLILRSAAAARSTPS